MFPKVFGCLEHTSNCFNFSCRGQNDQNETKITCIRGFRWIAGSTSYDSIRRPGIPKEKSGAFHKSGKHLKRFRVTKFGFARQVIWRGKICTFTSRNASSWLCSVDFDVRREMSISSLKTIVVHYSVTSLMMATNLQKGGRVHRVPCTKTREKLQELFQSVCVLLCKYKHCYVF